MATWVLIIFIANSGVAASPGFTRDACLAAKVQIELSTVRGARAICLNQTAK